MPGYDIDAMPNATPWCEVKVDDEALFLVRAAPILYEGEIYSCCFEVKDLSCIPEDVVCSGTIKWDGCTSIYTDDWHLCGPERYHWIALCLMKAAALAGSLMVGKRNPDVDWPKDEDTLGKVRSK